MTTYDHSKRIRKAIDQLLAPVDPVWEASIVDQFVARAHGELEGWAEYLSGPEPQRFSKGYRSREPHYVAFRDTRTVMSPMRHADMQVALKEGRYTVNEKLAIKDGKEAYQQIREEFVLRAIDKVAYVTQGVSLDSTVISGEIRFRGKIEGYIVFTAPTWMFQLNMSIKTNYRYDENAANRRLTIYSQYPFTFAGGVSEEQLGHDISGLPLNFKQAVAQDVKDAKHALKMQRRALDDQKYAINEILREYESIEYSERNLRAKPEYERATSSSYARIIEHRAKIAQLCAKYNIADPGSKKAALAVRKQILTHIKESMAATKAMRASP